MSRSFFALLALAGFLAPPAVGQEVRVAVDEENFRAVPSGLVLGVLVSGTPLRPGERRGRWREATLEGWIWAASVTTARAAGYQLQVSASDGENLRVEPNGRLLARLETGTLLERVEARGSWVRVRRTGWVWGPSLEGDEPSEPAPPPAAAEPAPPAAATDTADAADAAAPPATAPAADTLAEAPASLRPRMRAAGRAAPLHAAPGGDSVGGVASGAEVEVLRTRDGWARVRLEAWVPLAALESVPDGQVLRGLDPAELAADPERYRGRLVEWTLRFIALERAAEGRSEFRPGEAYLLTRGPGAAAGFVYVAVADERLPAVRGLAPLQALRLIGRVRHARSPLTGAPVLELVELEPLEGS